MIPQLIFIIEVHFTLKAKVVVQALFIVRMEASFGLEDLPVDVTTGRQISLDKISGVRRTDSIVLLAIPVFVVHMLPSGLLEFEMPIALLAEVVISVLYVVLLQSVIALEVKVEIAVVAGPMRVGIFLMLLEGTVVYKPSFTPVTVCHDRGS